MEFFYKTQGNISGPVSSSDLRLLALNGVVTPDTPLRAGTAGVWVRAGLYRWLFRAVKGFAPSETPESNKPVLIEAATMTVSEAYYVVFDLVGPALQDESHLHHPVSALRGYDLVQICTAFNLLVANEFLLYADREVFDEKVGEEKFAKGVELYASIPLTVVGNFVADDQADVALLPERAFELDDPRFLSQETASSFAEYCRSVGADDPFYWQKIYARLGLEYTSTSPRGNECVDPSSRPAANRQSPTCKWHPALRWLLFLPAGCLATTVAQALIRVYWWDFLGCRWLGEAVARAAEPVAFLAAALWVLPRFHRTFTLLFAVAYCGSELFFVLDRVAHSDSPWLPATSLVSGIWAAMYYLRYYTKTDSGKTLDTNT
jgi:hypothetical protein